MPPDQPPADVRRLADERALARAERDWARADALRDRIAELGWQVEDSGSGSTLRPVLPAGPALPVDRLADPAEVPLSIQAVADDHPDDLARLLRGLAAHPPAVNWELVIVANAPSFDLDELIRRVALPVAATVIQAGGRLGWADARTLGMRASRGEITLLLDPSIEPTGDLATPILAAFDDPSVGLAGGWGVRSADGRQFEDAPPGEVDAVEGYCLAVRRDALRAVGGFDSHFRFYRNADLDFSFAVRDAGWQALRTEPLPAARHEHRGWLEMPEGERDRLSKRNFYRFLDHWRGRTDLLTGRER